MPNMTRKTKIWLDNAFGLGLPRMPRDSLYVVLANSITTKN